MNELQIFYYNNSEVRTIEQNGEPWFAGKDVCAVFGDTNHSRSLSRVAEEDKASYAIDTAGGKQNVIFVNETGLYDLLFSMQPQRANHEGVQNAYPLETQQRIEKLAAFRKWVTHEVLPSIRKHGAYMTPETLEAAILNPDTMIKLCTALKDEQDKRRALEIANSTLTVNNQIMKPKADYFDELVDRNLLTNLRETAKQLGVKEKEFIGFLLDKKYVYRDKRGKLMPYADKNDGLFEIKECFNEKTQWSGTQTLVTPKGRETFRLLYLNIA